MADKKISALTAAATPLAGTEVLPIVQSGATVKVSVDNLTNGKTVTANKFYAPSTDATPIDIRRSVANNTVLANVADSPSLSNANYVLFGIDVSGGSVGYSSGGAFVSTGANGTGTARPLILHTYGNNDIVFARQNTQIASISANGFAPVAGKGIDFSANGGDVLTQYDQGSWTVKLFDAGGGGNQSATTVTGYYTRIGNLVHCAFSGLNNISTAGMTAGNNLYIELPFTAAATGIGTGSFASENIDFNGRSNATPVVTNSAGRAILRAYGSATTSATVLVSNVGANANIDYFSLTYRV